MLSCKLRVPYKVTQAKPKWPQILSALQNKVAPEKKFAAKAEAGKQSEACLTS